MADSPSLVMMALGDYRFGIATAAYQELERENDWRWECVDRIGSPNAYQFTGPGDEEVRMSGLIYPHFRGGLGQLDAMRDQADLGQPLQLVDGMGRVWGMFGIRRIREGQKTLFSNGMPRKIEFDISLINVGSDQ